MVEEKDSRVFQWNKNKDLGVTIVRQIAGISIEKLDKLDCIDQQIEAVFDGDVFQMISRFECV